MRPALRALLRPTVASAVPCVPCASAASVSALASTPTPPSSHIHAPSNTRTFSHSACVADADAERQGREDRGQSGRKEEKRSRGQRRQARKDTEQEERQARLEERDDPAQSVSVDGVPADGGANASAQASKSKSSGKRSISPLNLELSNFPSLLYAAHPLLDSGVTTHYPADGKYFPADHSVTHLSSRGIIPSTPPSAEYSAKVGLGPIASTSGASSNPADAKGAASSHALLAKVTPLSTKEIAGLYRHVLAIDRVVRQTGKGKIPKMRALVLAGNGRGLIGVGTAKDETANVAADKAFQSAVTKMDYIDRFEGRTIHATVEAKWGATTVTLRPRPPGFGLRVPPAVHAFARCVGISDLSASIEGSTNRHATVYALLSVLAGGPGNPIGLGDGLGGPGRRMDKGTGIKPVKVLEWERGRRFKSVLQ